MDIIKNLNGKACDIKLVGRLDGMTAPELENALKQIIDSVNEIIFDFTDLEYLSSAGLRVLLSTQKIMASKGSMVIKNVNEDIMEVFELTGFSDILTIK